MRFNKLSLLIRSAWLSGEVARGAARSLLVPTLTIAALGALESTAHASLVEALDLDALVAEAEQVVLARVISMNSHYDQRGQIVTDVAMQVEETLKGDSAPGAAVTVRRLGGVVDGVGMRVSGEPAFEVGETVLLFGRELSDGVTLRPLGMSQGAVRVFEKDGERWARSSAAGLSAVKRAGGKLRSAPLAVAEPRKLSELMGEIRSIVDVQKKR